MIKIGFDLICLICSSGFGLLIGVLIVELFFKERIMKQVTSDEINGLAILIGFVGLSIFEVLGPDKLIYVSVIFSFMSIGMVTWAFIIKHIHVHFEKEKIEKKG